jgi:DMSO/TMAO reductase YedYZ molybdopterin-dependent catalytic subunit
MTRRMRGLHELYRGDPEKADRDLFGRRADPLTRRGFLGHGGAVALGALLGAAIPFGQRMPAGLIPAALANTSEPFRIPGKDPGLLVLNDRPLNVETPAHLLDDDVTPASRLFVRNNGIAPAQVDPGAWRLEVNGESIEAPRTFSLAELQRDFASHSYLVQLECAGNGRGEFYPPTSGNQWTTGAVGCARWTGVRLRDVLDACGVKRDAVYVAYWGADRHPSGEPGKVAFSRGVPIAKAREDETLLAWAMNGEDIPLLHGHPLRLVCGGWPASTSGKWVTRIAVRDRVHDGPGMSSYRLPCSPIAPGEDVPPENLCIIESLPIKSLVTFPHSGAVHPLGAPLEIRGHAWAGDRAVQSVHLSLDFGQTWQPATLAAAANRLAWQRFRAALSFPGPGYYEVWARATDDAGRSQPMVVPGWNPKGYNNNACHRIAVRVADPGRTPSA